MTAGEGADGSRLRLLADENYPGPSVAFLRAGGYDILWVAETRPGIPDPEVVEPLQLTAIY